MLRTPVPYAFGHPPSRQRRVLLHKHAMLQQTMDGAFSSTSAWKHAAQQGAAADGRFRGSPRRGRLGL